MSKLSTYTGTRITFETPLYQDAMKTRRSLGDIIEQVNTDFNVVRYVHTDETLAVTILQREGVSEETQWGTFLVWLFEDE